MKTYREANIADIPRIVELTCMGLEELGLDYKKELVQKKVEVSYQLAPCFCLVINDIIVGIAGLTLISSSWNGDASLSEYMLYITPEHRNLKSLNALVSECKAFAVTYNLPLQFHFITDTKEGVKERLFEINGFKVIGTMGIYNEHTV